MAKPKTPSQKSRFASLNQRLNKYTMLVQQIFDDLNLEVAKAATSVSFDANGGKPFRFSDYPILKKRAEDLQQRYVDDIGAVIYSGTSAEWKKSNEVQDLLADGVLKAYGAQVNGEKYKIYYQPNNDALKAFQKRRANGMTLSQKLWNQASNYKEEMEYAISSAIEKGTSAVTLSKRLSKYLHDFPSLQKDYKDKFGKAVECHDCEYRSMRLARSEINMAYRTAEQTRWQQMDFVVGYEIKLSGAHPAEDICDMLKGKYPKDFVWTGWHPNDLCYKIPILKTEEEFWNYGEARNNPSSKEVKDVPDAFKKWVADNTERINRAKGNGTLPFFLKDNKSYVDKALTTHNPTAKEIAEVRHAARTEKDIDKIKADWGKRRIRQLNDYLFDGYLPDDVYGTTGEMYVLLAYKKYDELQARASTLLKAAKRHKARTELSVFDTRVKWNRRRYNILLEAIYDGYLPNEIFDSLSQKWMLFKTGKFDEFNKAVSPLFTAVKRHKLRTKEQIDSIKSAWEARRQSRIAGAKTFETSEDFMERMKKTSFRTPEEMDDLLFPVVSESWKETPRNMRKAAFKYTEDSDPFNSLLRGGFSNTEDIKLLTDFIDKQIVPQDVWVRRGVDLKYNFTGVDLSDASQSLLDGFVGRTVTEKAFSSCGVTEGRGFTRQVDIKIFVPKGTKGVYCDPFSAFGYNDGVSWDGIAKQRHISKEAELLLQRDMKFKITSMKWRDDGQLEIVCHVVD